MNKFYIDIGALLVLLVFLNSCSQKLERTNSLDCDLINILDFGALPNDGVDDTKSIQAAIDFAVKGKKSSKIFCPAGIYDLEKGIVLANQKLDGEYSFITLSLSGSMATYAGDQNIGKTTVFRLKNPTYGVALQSARNCVIENIVFEGCARYSTEPTKIMGWEDDKWGIYSKAITDRYSPSCAIVVDAFHVNVPLNNRYQGDESRYTNVSKGGSSMVLIKGCSFFNHYIAIANNPSGNIQNGDNIRAESCHVSTCHTFWSAGQTQSRSNSIDNIYAKYLHTFISGRQIGSQIGTPPNVSNLNLAGFCKQLIDINTGFSGVNFYRSYMESLWTLGISNGLSTSFDQCQFSFTKPTKDYFMPPFQLWASNIVAFRDCNIQYFANCDMPMPILFKSKGLILSGGSIEGGVVVADGYTNSGGDDMHKVSYDQVQIKCKGKIAGKKSSEKPSVNLKNEIIMGGEVILSDRDGMYINTGTTYLTEFTEEANILVDKNSKTASFTAKDPTKYSVGDNIFTLFDVDPKLSGLNAPGKVRSPLGYVSAIKGSSVIVSGVPYGYENRKDRIIVVRYPILTTEHITTRSTMNKILYYNKSK